ncbi:MULTISPECIES: hypothetical protein [Pantoea]|uniref:hypothetical protein n=1 Tax=Pantoea TaxID=53335 RepID=UPI002893091E|nr:hypothetical protein [Pantoea sp. UBA5923]
MLNRNQTQAKQQEKTRVFWRISQAVNNYSMPFQVDSGMPQRPKITYLNNNAQQQLKS